MGVLPGNCSAPMMRRAATQVVFGFVQLCGGTPSAAHPPPAAVPAFASRPRGDRSDGPWYDVLLHDGILAPQCEPVHTFWSRPELTLEAMW